jgi:hypothetical protein
MFSGIMAIAIWNLTIPNGNSTILGWSELHMSLFLIQNLP